MSTPHTTPYLQDVKHASHKYHKHTSRADQWRKTRDKAILSAYQDGAGMVTIARTASISRQQVYNVIQQLLEKEAAKAAKKAEHKKKEE